MTIALVGDVFAASRTENLTSTIGEVTFLEREIFFVEIEGPQLNKLGKRNIFEVGPLILN